MLKSQSFLHHFGVIYRRDPMLGSINMANPPSNHYYEMRGANFLDRTMMFVMRCIIIIPFDLKY